MRGPAFSAAQIEALRALSRAFGREQVVLIGASALGCFMDMRWRQTFDLDVCVAAALDDVTRPLERLKGWRRHPTKEHEWSVTGLARGLERPPTRP
jgi:hypothetical protein